MSRPQLHVRPFRPVTAGAVAVCLGLPVVQGCGGTVGVGPSSLQAPTGGSTGNATAALRATQLGYAWLPQDRTLRPILGLVGASHFGDSLTPAGAYVIGAASAVSQAALLVGSDGQLTRMLLSDGTSTSLGATGAGASAAIRFSPSGTSAVLFTPGAGAVTLVTGLRATAQVHALTAPAALADVAVSDAGSVAALMPAQGKGTVSLLRADGTASRLATLSGAGALSFTGTGEDLVTVDAGANSVTLTRAVSTAPSPVAVGTANLLKSPVAIGAAATGRWAVVVNSAEASVVRLDLTGQVAPQRLVLPVQPQFAEPLAYGAFRFSEAGSAPAWIADITASTPMLFFVPAVPSSSGV